MLGMDQGRRFYKLFDALMTYANDVLDVDPRLRSRLPFDWEVEERASVIDEIWENRAVIEDFVRENPRGFDTVDLECVLSWRSALRGMFYVKIDAGGTRFLFEDHVFDVSDLALPIAEMLTHAPLLVTTAILPFDGLIVYDTCIKELPVSISAQMREAFEESFAEALEAGRVVSAASRFEAVATSIAEKRLQRDIDSLRDDLGFDENPERNIASRMHRGVLAGLSEDERCAAMDEAFDSTAGSLRDYTIGAVESVCTKGAPTSSCVELLVSHKKDVIERLSRFLGVKGASSLNKRQLAERVVEAVLREPGMIKTLLAGLEPRQFRSVRTVFEAGGRMSVDKQDVERPAEMLSTAPLCLYAFDCGESFEFVIPDEVRALLGDFEWDTFEAYLSLCEDVQNIAELMAELRGVASLGEVLAEARRLCGDVASDDDYEVILIGQHAATEDGFELLKIDGEIFVVHYELADECLSMNEEIFYDEGVYDGCTEESLEVVRRLMLEQEGTPARPLSDDMLAEASLFEWVLKQPGVVAMRDFMDEHVPDGDNDLFFSERMLETLFDMSHGGYRLHDALEFLEGNDFFFDDDRLVQKELDLLSNLFNSLPRWDANGWAPNQLMEKASGGKAFFNEDGSIRKVGRNDPCPCGSGKKYKKCCGR